jgi:hypothetical protein
VAVENDLACWKRIDQPTIARAAASASVS